MAYPNPTASSNNLNVAVDFIKDNSTDEAETFSSETSFQEVEYTLYDQFGAVVRAVTSSRQTEISVQGLQDGLYTLKAVHENTILTRRIEIR